MENTSTNKIVTVVRFYSDAGAQKELILKENKGKSGIYR